MKSFVCTVLLATAVLAELPLQQRLVRFQQQELAEPEKPEVPRLFRFQRQELAEPEKTEVPRAEEAPYAPAGFTPAIEFTLPLRQEILPPATSYGIPLDSYSAPIFTYAVPQLVYGVPQTEYGVPEKKEEVETKIEEVTPESEVKVEVVEAKVEEKEKEKENIAEEPKKEGEVISKQGVYYVLLPDSQLQRVQFHTENDIRNMAYTAHVQYRNEERAPLYLYSSVPQYQNAGYVQLGY